MNPDRGGQWTRDDLPGIREVADGLSGTVTFGMLDGILNTVVAHLKVRHPKPAPYGQCGIVIGGQLTAPESQFKRERDDLRRQVADLRERRRKHTDERAAWTRNRRELEAERNAAVARAEQAEQLIPAYAMLDVWGALGRDSIHFDDWYDERGYADAWAELAAAVREAAEASDDPPVYVVRESHVRAEDGSFEVTDKGTWIDLTIYGKAMRPVSSAREVRGKAQRHVEAAARCEAIARAIEAEPADPVEAKARELYEVSNPDTVGKWETIHEAFKDGYRRMAAHVLGQEVQR